MPFSRKAIYNVIHHRLGFDCITDLEDHISGEKRH